jgi:hypothetical protein
MWLLLSQNKRQFGLVQAIFDKKRGVAFLAPHLF